MSLPPAPWQIVPRQQVGGWCVKDANGEVICWHVSEATAKAIAAIPLELDRLRAENERLQAKLTKAELEIIRLEALAPKTEDRW